jgi:RNA polymerase sigma factor (sigma-70 family)
VGYHAALPAGARRLARSERGRDVAEELRVPEGWPGISRQVEAFVGRFFRGVADVDVDDVVQETLLQLLQRCRSGRPVESPAALATVIARRRCIDALRRAYVSRRTLAEDADAPASPEGAGDDEGPAERREVRGLLLRVRRRLSPRCRVLLDQLLLGWRLSDVARRLGTTAGAVRNRWFHCRRQIQDLIAAWGIRREDLVG